MKKANYTTKPAKLQRDPSGTVRFRWGFETKTDADGNETVECYECVLHSTPTRNNVTQAAIEARWPKDVEQKLINDYYAAQEGILPAADGLPYLEFLAERRDLKDEIDRFFVEGGA